MISNWDGLINNSEQVLELDGWCIRRLSPGGELLFCTHVECEAIVLYFELSGASCEKCGKEMPDSVHGLLAMTNTP